MAAPPPTYVPLRPIQRQPPPSRWTWLRHSRLFQVGAGLAIIGLIVFGVIWVHYSRLIERKLAAGGFQGSSIVYAAPRVIGVGDPLQIKDIVVELQRSGYSESRDNRMGWYQLIPNGIQIQNGPDSYFQTQVLTIRFAGDKVQSISSDKDGASEECYLEPELISNLFGADREKRVMVQFHDIPPMLVQAVTSIEDKHFFEHPGFDLGRILKAAYIDAKSGRKEQGASTLSMQLARNFWLDQQKTWRRKLSEAFITLELEVKLSKERIFEYYANEVYLGQRGSFAIHGFGQAAKSYFGKDLRDITVPEAALLAGIIQRPSYFNPFRHPDQAIARRNTVLDLMHDNGYIDAATYDKAIHAPLTVTRVYTESTEAPYFVDMVNQQVQEKLNDKQLANNSYRIYTTLDPALQREAMAAVHAGLQEVDKQIHARKLDKDGVLPQVALIALDPQTGDVKAVVGGRNYGASQLNHAMSERQPGSIFKPFVYAAAFQNAALHKGRYTVTPATVLVDAPTTFRFGNQNYAPGNFHDEYRGSVTARTALIHSLNIPTVRVAEMAGYSTVANLAKAAGMNEDIKATPAVALGAYEVTPYEIAGAYTVFSHAGTLVDEHMIGMIRNRAGRVVYSHQIEEKPVLDPRAAYLVTNMMEDVLRYGTGAGVRARGFTLPAAGKTGTSHDGWFAGFTSKLLCIVWVGFDDNRELNLEGAKSALPIWTEFMKRAHQYHEYRDVQAFTPPPGVVRVQVCNESGQLATPYCPATHYDAFIAGTQPVTECELHGNGFFDNNSPNPAEPTTTMDEGKEKGKGVLGKILGIFK